MAGRNERALRARLRVLNVDTARDPRAALLLTLSQRMDSGEFSAHDAQQYRLSLEALERSTTTTAGSQVDEIRQRRARREQDARGAEGQSDTAP